MPTFWRKAAGLVCLFLTAACGSNPADPSDELTVSLTLTVIPPAATLGPTLTAEDIEALRRWAVRVDLTANQSVSVDLTCQAIGPGLQVNLPFSGSLPRSLAANQALTETFTLDEALLFSEPISDRMPAVEYTGISCFGTALTPGGDTTGFDGYATLTEGNSTASTSTCAIDPQTMCLLGNRFRVQATWRTPETSGSGQVLQRFSDGGSWSLHVPSVQSLFVQMSNNCTVNNRFWVFASGLTDVEYRLTVTDTHTGTGRSYRHNLGEPAPAIQDTEAFATCP